MTRYRPCLVCGKVTTGSRCAEHAYEKSRPPAAARGYGAAHVRARRELERSLPAACGYCGQIINPGERFDAAHVVDGDATAGYMVAHPGCNQRAKKRGGGASRS